MFCLSPLDPVYRIAFGAQLISFDRSAIDCSNGCRSVQLNRRTTTNKERGRPTETDRETEKERGEACNRSLPLHWAAHCPPEVRIESICTPPELTSVLLQRAVQLLACLVVFPFDAATYSDKGNRDKPVSR